MKLNEKILALKDEFVKIRKEIHSCPELGFDESKTSKLVAKLLKEYGYKTYEGIGKTGVVGQLKKGNSNKKIMLRADMDALPMQELCDIEYKSKNDGKMHACGHDGHTATLLLAAKHLATCNFNGTLNLIFQPAEELGMGAKAMIDDGLFERFPTDFIFGYHNMPKFNQGKGLFFCKSGGIMASIDIVTITIKGKGGHGSAPHLAKDPTIVAAQLLLALQTIVSRGLNPQSAGVISCGGILAGNERSFNIIANSCKMILSTRALEPSVREFILNEIEKISLSMAKVFDVEIECLIQKGSEVTFNNEEASKLALNSARKVFGNDFVVDDFESVMGSEDFGEYAKYTKAAYAFINNGNSEYVHHPKYIFNDDLLVYGACYYEQLVKDYLI